MASTGFGLAIFENGKEVIFENADDTLSTVE
jgi:hypothetical protein